MKNWLCRRSTTAVVVRLEFFRIVHGIAEKICYKFGVRWPGSALAYVRRGLPGRKSLSHAKQFQSQLSWREEQAKASRDFPHRTRDRREDVLQIWSALAWRRFGLRSLRSPGQKIAFARETVSFAVELPGRTGQSGAGPPHSKRDTR